MRICNMQRIKRTNDLTRAIFNVDFGILVVRDFKLREDGKGRLWASVPYKGGEATISIKDTKILEVITQAARIVYESGKREGENIGIAGAARV